MPITSSTPAPRTLREAVRPQSTARPPRGRGPCLRHRNSPDTALELANTIVEPAIQTAARLTARCSPISRKVLTRWRGWRGRGGNCPLSMTASQRLQLAAEGSGTIGLCHPALASASRSLACHRAALRGRSHRSQMTSLCARASGSAGTLTHSDCILRGPRW
jgi:hypothetical protein